MITTYSEVLFEILNLLSEEDAIRLLKRATMQKKYLAMKLLNSHLYALKRSDARAAEID